MRVKHPTRRDPELAAGEPLLELREARVAYGGIEALRGVSMKVLRGEIVALLGANGAGKTTALKSVARLVPIAGGSIRYAGVDVSSRTTEEMVHLGVSLVPEGRAIFASLSVRENLELGAFSHRDKTAMKETIEDATALFPRLGERMRQDAGTLSGGEQQMLAIARAMMARPALLLLDEPSLGIAPILVKQIFSAIAKIAASGVTVVLVEQNTRVALAASDRAYVLRTGEIVAEGAAKDLANDRALTDAYLGP